MKGKIIIGLTGMSGSGKSTVARELRLLGARVIDADAISRSLMNKGEEGYKVFVERWGNEYLDDAGNIDRRKLGKEIFHNEAMRKELGDLMHPLIMERVVIDTDSSMSGIVVWDMPLLIQCGLHKSVDQVWVVTAPIDEMVERIMGRDSICLEDARKRLESQISQEEQIKLADVVFINDRLEWDLLYDVGQQYNRLMEEINK